MNVQLDNALLGKTGHIVRAIVAGERDGGVLAKHRDGRCKADQATLAASLLFVRLGQRYDMAGAD